MTPPPSACPDVEADGVVRLCSRFFGFAWCITVLTKLVSRIFNLPSSTVQSYGAWSGAFQGILTLPANQDERETFLRLAVFGKIRRFSAVVNAYLSAQFVRIGLYTEDRYRQQADDVKALTGAIGQLQCSLNVIDQAAKSLSSAPGRWWTYANKVQRQAEKMRAQLASIQRKQMGSRYDRKDFLAGMSVLLNRLILLFAGADFKTPRIQLVGTVAAKPNRRAGKLIQSILGEVDEQDTQPVIRWIHLAHMASGAPLQYIRSPKALRDELDQRIIATPAWRRILQHKNRIDE